MNELVSNENKHRITLSLMKLNEDTATYWQATASVKTHTTDARFMSTGKTRNMAYTRVMVDVLLFLMDD